MPRSSNFGGVALRDAGVWSRSSGKGLADCIFGMHNRQTRHVLTRELQELHGPSGHAPMPHQMPPIPFRRERGLRYEPSPTMLGIKSPRMVTSYCLWPTSLEVMPELFPRTEGSKNYVTKESLPTPSLSFLRHLALPIPVFYLRYLDFFPQHRFVFQHGSITAFRQPFPSPTCTNIAPAYYYDSVICSSSLPCMCIAVSAHLQSGCNVC